MAPVTTTIVHDQDRYPPRGPVFSMGY